MSYRAAFPLPLVSGCLSCPVAPVIVLPLRGLKYCFCWVTVSVKENYVLVSELSQFSLYFLSQPSISHALLIPMIACQTIDRELLLLIVHADSLYPGTQVLSYKWEVLPLTIS